MGIEWNKLKFMVFDSPTPILSDLPYFKRHKFLKSVISEDHPIVEVPLYEVCAGREALEQKFFGIRAQEGEGIILRDANAPYIKGYSRLIYKHRGYLDAEAMVLKKISSNTFLCRVPKLHLLHNIKSNEDNETENDEKELENQFHDVEMVVDQDLFVGKEEDIEEKDFVSFRYAGEQRQVGPPMNPRIYCVRSDIGSWQQLIKSKIRKAPEHQQIWSPPIQVNEWKEKENRKKFFDEYAEKHNFNPLQSVNWYKISGADISSIKGGEGLLNIYSGSFINAVMDAYPNVLFDISKFKNIPINFWLKTENITNFFDSFAKEHRFDPLVPTNWYSINRDQILKKKGGSGVLKHFRTHIDALIRAYPFINFDPLQFNFIPSSFWQIKENRKMFFDNFAKSNNFDPLNPAAWNDIENRDIEEERGGNQVLSFYNKSLQQALADVYNYPSLSSLSFVKRKNPLNF